MAKKTRKETPLANEDMNKYIEAAFREPLFLDELIFTLQSLDEVPVPFPEKSQLSKTFRDLSLLKSLFRENSPISHKNVKLAIYLYLVTFTRLTITDLEEMTNLDVQLEVLKKYSKSLSIHKGKLDWPSFLRKHPDTKVEILACVFAFMVDSNSSSTGNTSRGDSVLGILSPFKFLRTLDPVEDFCVELQKERNNRSKHSK